jgi:hypothetical protein
MRINFFAQPCSSNSSAETFGLCDDADDQPAYISETDVEKAAWIAIVKNKLKVEIQFVAVDNCIDLRRANGDLESRCDGLLTYETNLDFVELKDKKYRWLESGTAQIENTIRLFSAFHDLKQYRRKRAFVSNRSFPQFTSHQTSTKERFRDQYGVRLFAQQEIII